MIIQHTNSAHQATAGNAEMTRQVAVAAAVAAGGGSAAIQLAIRNAEITFYRAVVASCLANGLQSSGFREALRNLGTGGV
jgi:hypothetical protein